MLEPLLLLDEDRQLEPAPAESARRTTLVNEYAPVAHQDLKPAERESSPERVIAREIERMEQEVADALEREEQQAAELAKLERWRTPLAFGDTWKGAGR